MSRPPTASTLGAWLATALTWGTVVSVGTVLIGVVLDLATGGGGPRGTGPNVIEVLGQAGPASIVVAGLLALGFVPPAALAVAAMAFGRDRERRYLIISSAVLALLLAGLVAAIVASGPGGG